MDSKTKKASSKSDGSEDSEDSDDDEDLVGPAAPTPRTATRLKKDGEEDDEEEEDEEKEESMVDKIPRSHEIKLVHGSKPITALSLDPSGARVITGGVDYDLKFWDFAGMDPSLRSFRKLRPCESHVINHLGSVPYNFLGLTAAKLIYFSGADLLFFGRMKSYCGFVCSKFSYLPLVQLPIFMVHIPIFIYR